MNNKDKIYFLKAAEKAFRKPPSIKSANQYGLCNYFSVIYSLSPYEIKEILGYKYKRICYTFCFSSELKYSGKTQKYIYDHNRTNQYFERADWCNFEVKRLEKEMEND